MRVFLVFAIAGAFLLYGIALEAPFELDDTSVLEMAKDLGPSTRPLGFATFWLDHQIIPIIAPSFPWRTPFYHRIGNVLIHALAATALFWLARELAGTFAAAVAGALFLVHPLQSAAITYITQRFESQAVLLMFVSAAAYVRFRKTGLKRWLAATLAAGLAAGFTKEIAVTLPLWLVFIEVMFFEGWKWRNRILYWVPLGGIALSLIFLVWPSFQNAKTTLTWVPWHQYFATQGAVLTKYFSLILWPARQFLIYDFTVVETLDALLIGKWVLVLAVLLGGVFLLKRNRLAGFGILTFFILLLPVLVLPLPDVFNEHRVYGPLAGIALAAAAGFQMLPKKHATVIVATIAIALGSRTISRNSEWNNQITFFEAHRVAFPQHPEILNRLASYYFENGGVNRALELFLTARQYEHRHNTYYRQQGQLLTAINLATVYMAKSNPGQAKVEALRAVAANPREPLAWRVLGNVQLQLSEFEDAQKSFQEMAKLQPGIDAWRGVLQAASNTGDAAAMKEAEEKIRAEEQRLPAADAPAGPAIPKEYQPYVIFAVTALLTAAVVLGFLTVFSAVKKSWPQIKQI